MKLRCTRRRGFTLIELLIVLAIIGLLAALTLPSLAMARSTARQITCASNQRQLGLSCQMYADSHDGVVLMNYTPTPSGEYATWDLTLLPYALNGQTVTSVFGNPLGQIPRPISIFAFPTSDDPATPEQASDYAKNNAFSRAPQGTPPDGPLITILPDPLPEDYTPGTVGGWEKNSVKLWQITRPQQTFEVADSAVRDLDLLDMTTAIGRHSGNDSEDTDGDLNIVFYDSHVTSMNKADMKWGTAGPWLPYTGY